MSSTLLRRARPGRCKASCLHRAYSSTPSPAASAAEIDNAPTILPYTPPVRPSALPFKANKSRRQDSPSYILHTFIPPQARDAYLALRAFNLETARIADSTSQPTIGAMRFQFWRDSVTATLHLPPTTHRGGSRLSRAWLHRIISEREKYLGNRPYPALSALETYAENTYSTFSYLTLSSLPLSSLILSSITADHLASHIGKATGIVAVLRSLPLLGFPPPPSGGTAQGSAPHPPVLLPLDIMAAHSVQEETILRTGPSAPGLRDAVFEDATRANDHLITAREMLRSLLAGQGAGHAFEHEGDAQRAGYDEVQSATDVPSGKALREVEAGFGVLMGAVPTRMWLERLERVDFDVFDGRLRGPGWRLPWEAWWAFRRRRI
ncbi:hypothetical protein EJ06DRAFT_534923 [Trichodelitschia bisporula]|uniref:Squalene/phytoene synthase n=1 Tax=Trichodelitschia bisporula TaxID=703511 RepID=A0A6G1HHN0_9PEZI|nr:hypothetical protein EJ06DRAFT_534923 [Trichodelitschia bisporula]